MDVGLFRAEADPCPRAVEWEGNPMSISQGFTQRHKMHTRPAESQNMRALQRPWCPSGSWALSHLGEVRCIEDSRSRDQQPVPWAPSHATTSVWRMGTVHAAQSEPQSGSAFGRGSQQTKEPHLAGGDGPCVARQG